MTSDVLVVSPDDPVSRVQDLMEEKRIRHVPVVDEDRALVGIVSERDLLRRAIGADMDLPLSLRTDVLSALKVRDVMTWDVETVDVDVDVASAAQILLENKYGSLPVVEEGELCGILTEADFVRYVAVSREETEPVRASRAPAARRLRSHRP
jgi:CBS domain-containing protein